MGCKGSKESPKEQRKIKSKMQKVGVDKYDSFFEGVQKLLEAAEEIREGLEDSKDEGIEQSHVYKLKDPKFLEVFRVAFWTLSANSNGEIKKCKPVTGSEAPFIKMEDSANLNAWARDLWGCCDKWLKTVIEAPKNLQTIVDSLTNDSKKVTEFNIKEDTASLAMKEKFTAAKAFAANAGTLTKGLAQVTRLPPILKDAVVDSKDIIANLKELVTKADEVGKPACDEVLYYPSAIFDKFHKGEKLSEEEIKKKQEEIEKFNGGKPKESAEEKKGRKESRERAEIRRQEG